MLKPSAKMALRNMHGDMGIQGFLGHNKRRKIMFGDEVFFEQLRRNCLQFLQENLLQRRLEESFPRKACRMLMLLELVLL